MRRQSVFRVLLLSLIAVVTLTGGASAKLPIPSGTRTMSITTHHELALVQTCEGSSLVTSYTVTRDYQTVTDGAGYLVHEHRHVRFVGILDNTKTARSLPYDGEFTRTADYDAGTITITDLVLHLGLPGSRPITVAIDRLDQDLTDDPPAMLRDFAPPVVAASLCGQLDRPSVDDLFVTVGPFLPR